MLDRIITVLAVISGILLISLACLICLDVLVRNLKLFSMGWTLEIAEYLLYAITFCAAPWVLRNGGHIAVDLLVQNISAKNAQLLTRISYLLGAVVCAVLFFYAGKVLWASYTDQTLVYKALVLPEWPFFLLPPLTFGLMLCLFLRWLWHPELAQQSRSDGF